MSVNAFADSCRSIFNPQSAETQIPQEKTLNVAELAAYYRSNYLKSEEGKQEMEALSRLLKIKIVPQQIPNMPFHEVRVKPKNLTFKTLEQLKQEFPDMTIIYNLNEEFQSPHPLNY